MRPNTASDHTEFCFAGDYPRREKSPSPRRPSLAYLHFLPALPDALPRVPPEEKHFTRTRDILNPLPAEPVTEAVWRGVPRSTRALTLLL